MKNKLTYLCGALMTTHKNTAKHILIQLNCLQIYTVNSYFNILLWFLQMHKMK